MARVKRKTCDTMMATTRKRRKTYIRKAIANERSSLGRITGKVS